MNLLIQFCEKFYHSSSLTRNDIFRCHLCMFCKIIMKFSLSKIKLKHCFVLFLLLINKSHVLWPIEAQQRMTLKQAKIVTTLFNFFFKSLSAIFSLVWKVVPLDYINKSWGWIVEIYHFRRWRKFLVFIFSKFSQ